MKLLIAEQLRDCPVILIDPMSPSPYNKLPRSQPISVIANPGAGITLGSLISSSTRTKEA